MVGTKRPHCWVDYDSDDSHTLSEGESATTRTTAAPTKGAFPPQTKRRRVLEFHPAAVEGTSSPSSEIGPATFTFVAPSPLPSSVTTAPQINRDLPAYVPLPPTDGRDLLSLLSNELLLKILSYLPLQHLLAVAPVSRKFYHLAGDSQLWKALYYERFVLPRALRIPGFPRGGALPGSGRGPGHKLHYSGRRRIWADGRLGGIVDEARHGDRLARTEEQDEDGQGDSEKEKEGDKPVGVNWKRQYKIRYNWSRGKCVVEELRVGVESGDADGNIDVMGKKKMLAKVVEGIAITADENSGLRAWDLKTRKLVAQVDLTSAVNGRVSPSCIDIDEKQPNADVIDIAVGFIDGSFGVWRVFLTSKNRRIQERYRHESSSNGGLIAMAFSYPYLLTATEAVLISLYTFDVPENTEDDGRREDVGKSRKVGILPAPYLLTSLNSHTSRPPLALSIRKAATATIASIAYTFSTLQGWSIGIQDLHIRPGDVNSTPDITTTQIAYTTPMDTGYVLRLPPTPPSTTTRRHQTHRTMNRGQTVVVPQIPPTPPEPEAGPTSLCYTHPYLLATLPDNTLILHMCTSNASSLSISPGIRLWGHTSGISDAEVTARGKAVSVSSRGEEMRVWELEGRMAGVGSSRSVEIKPGSATATSQDGDGEKIGYDWEERRSWVGFDDEMVIVLKERKGGSESLMVYDFT